VDAARFRSLPQLDEGAEARVYHDEEGKVVYKLFEVRDGKAGEYVPGQMRLAADGQIRGWSASHLSGIPWANGPHTNAACDPEN
jgi:hypothetical protein